MKMLMENLPQNKKRLKSEISVLNVLFCLMVIFIHITSYTIAALDAASPTVKVLHAFWRLCSCAVYGFIFLSGVKLFLKEYKDFSLKKFYVSRLKKIVLPYVVAVIFYYLFEISRGYYEFSFKELGFFLLSGKIECHLYFVVIIIQFYLLMPLWQKLVSLKNKPLLLTGAFLLNVFFVYQIPKLFGGFGYNDRVFTSYIFFWLLGCVCGKCYNRFLAVLKKSAAAFILFFIICFAADAYLSYICKFGIYYKITETVHLLYCFGAILFFYCLAYSGKVREIAQNKIFKRINDASYEIYLVHIFVLYKANDFILCLKIGELKAWILRAAVVYSVSILLCVAYKALINIKRSRF